jgi:hypothetical protein
MMAGMHYVPASAQTHKQTGEIQGKQKKKKSSDPSPFLFCIKKER